MSGLSETVPFPTSTTNTCSYTDSDWGNLLTAFNGVTITYDKIGNPLNYYNGSSYTFTWQGRELIGAVKGSNTMSFTYNDIGLRVSKTVNGVTTHYIYDGDLLLSKNSSTANFYRKYFSPLADFPRAVCIFRFDGRDLYSNFNIISIQNQYEILN